MAIKTAVVIAGAVARGAYEAGALSAILSRELSDRDLSETLFVGTSAGAINAVLWAGLADGTRSVAQVGEAVCDVWRRIDDTAVFAVGSSLVTAGKGLFHGHPTHLLDTKPLGETVHAEFARLPIGDNIAAGHVGGVALAATFCGRTTAGARSEIFYQASVKPKRPTGNRALDYTGTPLTAKHVLASSAVPVLFEPVEINGPYYVDGGVMLNTPIAPALAFGAERVIVVSSHATEYPPREALPHVPSGNDALAIVLHTVLADKTIEDLAQLKRINSMVVANPNNATDYKTIEYIVVSPKPGVLAAQARASLDEAFRPSALLKHAARAVRYGLLQAFVHRLGAGVGANELLSYILFDREYFERQIARGRQDAASAKSWQT